MNCDCHLYINKNCPYCKNLEQNQNKDELIQDVSDAPPRLLPSSFENMQNNINDVNNNDNEEQVNMQEESIDETSNVNKAHNDYKNPSYNESDSFRDDFQRLINPENKE